MVTANQQALVICEGSSYGAWDSVSVRAEYNNGIRSFSFSVSEDPYGVNTAIKRFDVGTSVQITLGGQVAIDGGVIKTRSVSYDKGSYQVVFTGTGQSYKATESSIPMKQGNYNGYTLQQAGNTVLQPLGISFTVNNDSDTASQPFKYLAVNPGETPAEFLTKLATCRGLMLTADKSGGIVAHRQDGSGGSITLKEGSEILTAHCVMNNDNVVGKYSITANTPGSDSNFPPRGFSASSSQSDGITGTVAYLVAEHPLDADELKVRAQHENSLATWTRFECALAVNGWTSPDGELWDPLANKHISVYSPMLFPGLPYSQDCLLQSVELRQDRDGSVSHLELMLYNIGSKFGSAPGVGSGNGGSSGAGAGGDSEQAQSPTGQTEPPDDQPQTAPDGQPDSFGSVSAVQKAQPAFPSDAQTDEENKASETSSKQTFPKNADDSSDFDSNGQTST